MKILTNYQNNCSTSNKAYLNSYKALMTKDSVNFGSKEVFKEYSCKNADMLRYDVEYTKPSWFKKNYQITGKDIKLNVENKILRRQRIKGEAFKLPFDIDIKWSILRPSVSGSIGNEPVKFEYEMGENKRRIKIFGNIDKLNDKTKALVIMLLGDKHNLDLEKNRELEMATYASVPAK